MKSNMKQMVLKKMESYDESENDIEQVKVYEILKRYDSAKIGESIDDLDIEFKSGYGGENGPRFFVWTEDRIYFKQIYDGSESIASVPRNPCNETPSYIGG